MQYPIPTPPWHASLGGVGGLVRAPVRAAPPTPPRLAGHGGVGIGYCIGIGYWILVLDIGYWILDIGIGYWILDIGYWILVSLLQHA